MKTLRELLLGMEDPRRVALLAIYDRHRELFHYATGSGHNHQAWEGGYADHIADCIRVNLLTWEALNAYRPLGFTADSATIVLFFHDIEKPFRYGPVGHAYCWPYRNRVYHIGGEEYAAWEFVKNEILADLESLYGFELTEDEHNALRYTHGEGSDHQKLERVSCPLAAHVHHCDNISARIYHDDGRGQG